jgi:acetoin utilization deacetylase AcuC-like enzyme
MKCAFHADYRIFLPPSHPYPMGKYLLLKDGLLAEGLIREADLLTPDAVGREAMALVHTPDYLDKLESSCLSPAEIRRLGIPWTDALWRRSRLAAGGTLLAARRALLDGLAANLAGGTHHAFADHGEGFCVLNDIAIAIRCLQREGAVRRAAVIDLDVHQGNGTAAIFQDDQDVFTFSMHGENNYPLQKMRSSLDVGLPAGTADEAYLAALALHLPAVLRFDPDIVFYLAGVDVLAGDRYGKLALSEHGLQQRERRVLQAVRGAGLPAVIVLGGGYAMDTLRTAHLHLHVFREAALVERASHICAESGNDDSPGG